MDTIKIWNDNPSDAQSEEIARVIESGELVIMPTDSVYAIVCDALEPKAIARLCQLKGLDPSRNNLSIICSGISMAAEFAHIDDAGFRLLKANTPGAFTFLFKSGRNLPKAFKGRKTVGIRIPDNATARRVVETLGHPVLVTSVEFDDADYAREPELIAENYDRRGVAMIVDGGEGGVDYSTILNCADADAPEILRQGKGNLL